MILIINPSTKFSTPQFQIPETKNVRLFLLEQTDILIKTNVPLG